MKISLKATAIALTLLVAFSTSAWGAPVNIAQLTVDTTKASNPQDLAKKSDLVVYGRFGTPLEEYPTAHTANGKKLVNYVQSFHGITALKGSTDALVRVLTTGVSPLPMPTDPLNKTYSGPIAEGHYVCFLKKVPGTDLYTVVGVWQGLYPVINEKTVALEETGFPEYGNLTVRQIYEKIKSQ